MPAKHLENLGRAPEDRPLDAGDFGTDVITVLNWATRSRDEQGQSTEGSSGSPS